jgi:hypothetical protein
MEHLTWADWIHHSWRFGHAEALCKVGPEELERGSKTQTVPVVWATFGILSFCVIQMISCHDWWPRTKPGYITITRRQSNNQWSGGIAPHAAPKNSKCKNSLENFSPWLIFWSRQHPLHWLSYKGPAYQSGVLLISAGANEGHFEWKTSR